MKDNRIQLELICREKAGTRKFKAFLNFEQIGWIPQTLDVAAKHCSPKPTTWCFFQGHNQCFSPTTGLPNSSHLTASLQMSRKTGLQWEGQGSFVNNSFIDI